MVELVLNFSLFLIGLYLIYIGAVIFKIPNENWVEYKRFKGNGRGMKIDKDGNLVSVKYKTKGDYLRFINGIRVINFHNKGD
jgi:hypothetical protein